MIILDLSLCYKWFDMIDSGVKREEYREKKTYYNKRFINMKAAKHMFEQRKQSMGLAAQVTYKEALKYFPREYDAIRFHRGRGGKLTMLFECKSISIGFGNPDWGAPTDRKVFIIKLGERLDV